MRLRGRSFGVGLIDLVVERLGLNAAAERRYSLVVERVEVVSCIVVAVASVGYLWDVESVEVGVLLVVGRPAWGNMTEGVGGGFRELEPGLDVRAVKTAPWGEGEMHWEPSTSCRNPTQDMRTVIGSRCRVTYFILWG